MKIRISAGKKEEGDGNQICETCHQEYCAKSIFDQNFRKTPRNKNHFHKW